MNRNNVEAAAAAAAPLAAGAQRLASGTAAEAEDSGGSRSDTEVRRRVNWMLGVTPQDVRFPVNISELAFTQNYFAALTADKVKIFVNRRVPEEKANCKKKTIEFDIDARPRSIVSFDFDDCVCVVFQAKVEFYSLATLEKVGVYQTSLGEVVTTAASLGQRSPLGALWCLRDTRKLRPVDRQSTFTFWQQHVSAPHQLQFGSLLPRADRFLSFSWTSPKSILLMSEAMSSKPVQLCSLDVSERRVLGRASRRSVRSHEQIRLSPNGRLLVLLCRSKLVLADAVTLETTRAVPHQLSQQQRLRGLDFVVNNCGDLALLDRNSLSVEFHLALHRLSDLGDGRRFELGRCATFQDVGTCQLHAVGSFGVLFAFKHDGREEGDQPKHYSSYSIVVLLDMQGHVILRAEWPRGFLHLVTDELLVYLQYLCAKPFSAAHACIFDFGAPVAKKSHWAAAEAAGAGAGAVTAGDVGGDNRVAVARR